MSSLKRRDSVCLQAIAVFLIGEIIASLCIAFVFRYHMLMPRSDATWIQSAIRKLPVLAVTLGYGNGFIYGGLTYMVFLDKEATEKKIH